MPKNARIRNIHLVIVGVDDYSTHDLAAGQARGTSHLDGGVADALAWWSLLRRLGVPASAMRLLLGRVQGRRYAVGRVGAKPRAATRANLASALAEAAAGADARHPTLLVFAGRGGWHTTHGPRLCLEDSASLDDAVDLAGVIADFRNRTAGQLLVVADCGFFSAREGAGVRHRAMGPARPAAERTPLLQRFATGLPASAAVILGPGTEIRGIGGWRGALSDALQRTILGALGRGERLEVGEASLRASAALEAELGARVVQLGSLSGAAMATWWLGAQPTLVAPIDPTALKPWVRIPPPGDWQAPQVGPTVDPESPDDTAPLPPSWASQLPIGTFGIYDDSGIRNSTTRYGYVEVTSNPYQETFHWLQGKPRWPSVFRIWSVNEVKTGTIVASDTFTGREFKVTTALSDLTTQYGVTQHVYGEGSPLEYQISRVITPSLVGGKQLVAVPLGYARFGQTGQGVRESDWYANAGKRLPLEASDQPPVFGTEAHLRFESTSTSGITGGAVWRWHPT